MGPLKLAAAALALLAASPLCASPAIERWRPYIAEASLRFGVPERWIERVMRAESGGRTMLGGRPITSHAGAMGLMQVMPGTYRDMARAHALGPDPHAPRDNILAGTAYLRAMYDRYGYPGLFAAYNAGPGRYQAHLRGRALPLETRIYVEQVAGGAGRMGVRPPRETAQSFVESRPRESIFFVLRRPDEAPLQASGPAHSTLFVVTAEGSRTDD